MGLASGAISIVFNICRVIYLDTLCLKILYMLSVAGISNTWQRSTWRNIMYGIGFGWLLQTRNAISMSCDTLTSLRMRERRKIEELFQYSLLFLGYSFVGPAFPLFALWDVWICWDCLVTILSFMVFFFFKILVTDSYSVLCITF